MRKEENGNTNEANNKIYAEKSEMQMSKMDGPNGDCKC